MLCQHMNTCQLIITLAQLFPLKLYIWCKIVIIRNKHLFYKLFALFCCLCTTLYAALILSKFRDHICMKHGNYVICFLHIFIVNMNDATTICFPLFCHFANQTTLDHISNDDQVKGNCTTFDNEHISYHISSFKMTPNVEC